MKNLLKTIIATFAVVITVSCNNDDDIFQIEPGVVGPNVQVYGLSSTNELVSFNANNPSTFTSKIGITGITGAEKLLSIDFRPATGELYAVSDASKFYIINTSTASARLVSTTPFVPAISGSIASIDFNPTVDRIRLVTNTGQNLRLNPENGAIAATDGSISGGASPVISGVAYTNSVSGASSTTLYDLDATSGKLYKQDPPNNGTLVEVGNTGISFTGQAAFDISPDNSIALMAATSSSQENLYTLDLANGKAVNIGKLPSKVIDLAIPTKSVAYAVNAANALQIFDPTNPIPVTKAITGLQASESILGIDFRPLNGQLYALGSSSRIYTINLGNGAATVVGGQLTTLLSGTDFGFDFNPTVDRIRVVSNTGQNLRLNPIDGSTIIDGTINPGTPALSAAAYTNNFAGATTTTLFVIDATTDRLYQQNPANSGTLVDVGALGINVVSTNGFDIGSKSQTAYSILTVGTETKIYTINTTTGAATSVSNFPNTVKGFSVGLGF
ncbi:DUF4394 domain-containing protein [Frigoriflavimonas asaccharolytica]|uniref:DUF4394 domain-containing protein n=1 Tax=Frigoriflavimonas asaccharolytica TaxID=2735899 RepID=A0A8J8K6R0_9FLAO|nr:DUF4394 domain-containing protein [Frigoriflavimonas asaccharolytica]NRS94020.1 hypothetical protein [Frigoriflavimonas asaccharolytica]